MALVTLGAGTGCAISIVEIDLATTAAEVALPPSELLIRGPATLHQGVCSRITLTLRDINGGIATSSEAIDLILGGGGAGTYYSRSSTCSSSIGTLQIPASTQQVELYYLHSGAPGTQETLDIDDGSGGLDSNTLDVTVAAKGVAGAREGGFNAGSLVSTQLGTSVANGGDAIADIVVQPDGKIFAIGEADNGSNKDFAIARYLADGSLDTSFSGDGKLVIAIGSDRDHAIRGALQPDGKLLVVGYYASGADWIMALVRINSDGTLDSTFGTGGIVTEFVNGEDTLGEAVALQPDGKILVGGTVGDTSSTFNPEFMAIRYLSNGARDTSFGSGGVYRLDLTSSHVVGIKALSSGKIIVAGGSLGSAGIDFTAIRLESDGTLDGTYGTLGVAHTGSISHEYVTDAVVSEDGKVAFIGHAFSTSAVVGYLDSGGTPLAGFNGGAVLVMDMGDGNDHTHGLAIAMQPDGRLLIGTRLLVIPALTYSVHLSRLTTAGIFDNTFDGDGKVPEATYYMGAISIQPDGLIFSAGSDTTGKFGLARYWP